MTDTQNTLPNPTSAKEAQDLINELRDRFDLDLALAPRDFRRGVSSAVGVAHLRRPADLAGFTARHADEFVAHLVELQDYVGHDINTGINDMVEEDVFSAAYSVLDQVGESGWTAEVVVKLPGAEPETVQDGDDFSSALEAEAWARKEATEVATRTSGSVSIRLTLPSVSLTLEEEIS